MKKLLGIFAVLIGLNLAALAQSKDLPDFSFLDLEGNMFSKTELVAGKGTIFVFFDPYCDHCATQATWITEAAGEFNDVQFVWVTTETQAPTLNFYNQHFKNSGLKHITVLRDVDFMFDTYFGYTVVPGIIIYDENGRRVKSYNEETRPEVMLSAL
ncbi:MAG: redoxin domain-containing protein [Bacteroidota bacterium]